MQLFATGNLFIGASPSDAGYKLDVNGTGRFSGALSGTKVQFLAGSYGATYANNFTGDGTFAYGSSTAIRFTRFAYNSGDQPGVELGYDVTNNNGIIAGATQATGAGLDFWTFNGSSWASRFTIASTGAATFSSTLGINGVSDNVKSGTYTPTVTKEVGSMTSISAASATYTRVGNVVTVVATFTGTPDSGTNQYNALSMTLPINTNSANGIGNIVAQTIGGIPSACGIVYGNTTSTVYFDINTNYPAPNTQFVVSFQYQVTL
jgi:hypothetical protein